MICPKKDNVKRNIKNMSSLMTYMKKFIVVTIKMRKKEMGEIKKYFGKNLKRLRKRKGYSQEVLAEKIGIYRRQLTRIETGKSFPSIKTLDCICEKLEVLPSQLFDFSEFNDVQNEETKNVLYYVAQKQSKNLAILKEICENLQEYEKNTSKLKFIKLAIDCLKDKKAVEKMADVLNGMKLFSDEE